MRTWRLDPPACDCRNICKNPNHNRPEWVEEPMTLVERIIQYAQQEVSEGKQTVENHACLSHEEWKVIEGRVEFAEGLLANIKEWQDEDEYEMGQARLRLSQ